MKEAQTSHIDELIRVAEGARSARDAISHRSWRRCIGDHKLDPTVLCEAHILPSDRRRSGKTVTLPRSRHSDSRSLVLGATRTSACGQRWRYDTTPVAPHLPQVWRRDAVSSPLAARGFLTNI
ncbi:MAG TPA: hypothetical protein VGD08_25150 [Stellaceae bacterium]